MSDKGEVQTEMAVQRNHSQFVVKMIILFKFYHSHNYYAASWDWETQFIFGALQ